MRKPLSVTDVFLTQALKCPQPPSPQAQPPGACWAWAVWLRNQAVALFAWTHFNDRPRDHYASLA